MHNYVSEIENLMAGKPGCSNGITYSSKAFVSEYGYSGKPELLALISDELLCDGYWYGHVCWHEGFESYVALIVCSRVFVNAEDVPILLARFNYWMRMRVEYRCILPVEGADVFDMALEFERAADALKRMIAAFDRNQFKDEFRFWLHPRRSRRPYRNPLLKDFHVARVYGCEGAMDGDGFSPPAPIRQQLQLVSSDIGGEEHA